MRPNVPEADKEKARRDLAGYYAHIAALDDCIGDLLQTLRDTRIADDTIFVFTSDHGDMLCSQGGQNKQQPWDESIRVPFLLRYPALLGRQGETIDMPINTPDIMPTLLGLSGIAIPRQSKAPISPLILTGKSPVTDKAALICCSAPSASGRERKAAGSIAASHPPPHVRPRPQGALAAVRQ